MKRAPKQANTVRLADQQRAIVAERAAGTTRKAIAAKYGVTVAQVKRAEWHAEMDAKGRKLLAVNADSLDGLSLVRQLCRRTAWELMGHHYNFDGPELETLRDVAAMGRAYVRGLGGIGPKRMAELDGLLARFGIEWNPEPRPLRPRRLEPAQPEQSNPEDLATTVLRLRVRVAYLEGYLEGYIFEKARARETMRDITPEPDAAGCESVGNLICLPGVTLSDVLGSHQNDGGRS